MEERIVKFIRKHHVLTLATAAGDGTPYCSNAFYAYDAKRNVLIFTSEDSTRHAAQMRANPAVAASIVLETRIVGRVQGVQICGQVAEGGDDDRKVYLKRFPYAAVMGATPIWRLEPDFIKLTDNTLGFGKKLIWTKNSIRG